MKFWLNVVGLSCRAQLDTKHTISSRSYRKIHFLKFYHLEDGIVLSPRGRNFGFVQFRFIETKASWVQKLRYFEIFGGPEINMGA
jgi:hypothetical protein